MDLYTIIFMDNIVYFFSQIKYKILNNIKDTFNMCVVLWYDFLVGNTTKHLYNIFLNSVPSKSEIMDIGIGTGIITKNYELIKNKQLHINGIDVNRNYLDMCHKKIEDYNLKSNITTHYGNVLTYETDKKYDFVLFSDSYSVIPNINYIVNHTNKYLKENGEIVIITTLDDKGGLFYNFRKWVKPRLVNITGIEFGNLITYNSFINEFRKNYYINDCSIIKNKWFPFYGRIAIYMIKLTPKND